MQLDSLTNLITTAIRNFQGSIGSIQKELLKGIERKLKDLELSGGTVRNTVQNLRLMNDIRAAVTSMLVDNANYKKAVKEYASVFNTIDDLQTKYFAQADKNFQASEFTEEMRRQMIDQTVKQLGEQGIAVSLQDEVTELLRQNITTGSEYSDLVDMLRQRMTDTDTDGALQRYAKQITVDAVNQYSAQNLHFIASDLGYEWFRYAGHDIDTTRPFCDAMTDREYFHISEVPDLLAAKDLRYRAKGGEMKPVPIYQRTGLPGGMIEGTNVSNFFVRRGGYNCGHQILPTNERLIPESIKNRVFATDQYKTWSKIKGTAPKRPDPTAAGTKTPPKKQAQKTAKKAAPTQVDPMVELNQRVTKAHQRVQTRFADALGLKVKDFKIAADINPALTPERLEKMADMAEQLANTYNLSGSIHKDFGTRLFFSSDDDSFGFVRTGGNHGEYLLEINFGHRADTYGRTYKPNSTELRGKSRVDPENIEVATVVHEFAHVIAVQRRGAIDPTVKKFYSELRKLNDEYSMTLSEIWYGRRTDISLNDYHIGEYAMTNLNEFMAEGFTEYRLSSNPSPMAVKIGKLIDKYFLKKTKK